MLRSTSSPPVATIRATVAAWSPTRARMSAFWLTTSLTRVHDVWFSNSSGDEGRGGTRVVLALLLQPRAELRTEV